MNIFNCINCGKEYQSNKKNSKFCSIECRRQYNNIEYNCDYCKKPIIIYRGRYEKLLSGEIQNIFCSRECSTLSQTTKVLKICQNCGKEYKIGKCFDDIQKFCSRKCFYEYKSKNAKCQMIMCEQCGKIFKQKYPKQKYCSYQCSGEAMQNRLECTCSYCGKTFERIKSDVEKSKKHYCSKICKLLDIKWNPHDIEILRNTYGKLSNLDIQKQLDKKWDIEAIKREAIKLELCKDRTWTDKEIIVLKNNYSNIPIFEMLKLLPDRTISSIRSKAKELKIKSLYYSSRVYTKDEEDFIRKNYLSLTNKELADQLHGNRTETAISQRLCILNLHRPTEIKKEGYLDLKRFMRSRLTVWKNKFRELHNYTCCVTGSKSNIIVHHCRSFNLLMEETIELLDFPIKDTFNEYTDEELEYFVDNFMDLQDCYNACVCISENIHKLFHSEYGYGNNTENQWNEFVENYKKGKYKLIA